MRRRILPDVMHAAKELRHPMTEAENILWARLRDRRLGGYKFRRQHAISFFILDFFCAEKRLAIEVDGPSHLEQVEYDQWRTERLNDFGIRVIRFTNREVECQVEAVLGVILAVCQRPE